MLNRAKCYGRPRLPPNTKRGGSHAWKAFKHQKKRSKEKGPPGSYRLGCVGGYIFWLHRTGRWAGSRGRHRTTNMAWKTEGERKGGLQLEMWARRCRRRSALHVLEKRLAWWLTPVWSGIGSNPCCRCMEVEEKQEFGHGPTWAKEATLCKTGVVVRSRIVHVLLKLKENRKNWQALLCGIPEKSRKSACGLKSQYSNVSPNRKKRSCFD